MVPQPTVVYSDPVVFDSTGVPGLFYWLAADTSVHIFDGNAMGIWGHNMKYDRLSYGQDDRNTFPMSRPVSMSLIAAWMDGLGLE